MRSPSIEWLHAKIDKRIKLVASYVEMPELEFIIKSCRLKPYDYMFSERDNKITLHEWWFDEFGNSLKIAKGKKINLVLGDLRLDRKKITCTDLYYGLSIDRIVKMSKLVYVITGKDEDLYQECSLLTFVGIDNHLRSYLFWDGNWRQVPPLILGMKNLKLIANHQDIKYYLPTANKENSALPCISSRAWLSYLPASTAFLSEISQQSELLTGILKQ